MARTDPGTGYMFSIVNIVYILLFLLDALYTPWLLCLQLTVSHLASMEEPVWSGISAPVLTVTWDQDVKSVRDNSIHLFLSGMYHVSLQLSKPVCFFKKMECVYRGQELSCVTVSPCVSVQWCATGTVKTEGSVFLPMCVSASLAGTDQHVTQVTPINTTCSYLEAHDEHISFRQQYVQLWAQYSIVFTSSCLQSSVFEWWDLYQTQHLRLSRWLLWLPMSDW